MKDIERLLWGIGIVLLLIVNVHLQTKVQALKKSTADAWYFLKKYEDRLPPMGKFESCTNFNTSSTPATNYSEWIVIDGLMIDVSTQYQDVHIK